jgi:thiamine-monophosphate kinase
MSAMSAEFDFIQWLMARNAPSDFVLVPPGDDLAVLKWAAEDLVLVGVDQVLDGVHFDSSAHSAGAIGRKVMNRNLSDCAAMACLPAAAVATVALPEGKGIEYLRELYLGMRGAGAVFRCPIVGGDTASWGGKLAVTVTIIGRSAGIAPVKRSGAKPGDSLYVTGPLGGSILGRHMTFEPSVRLARELAEKGIAAAMIDLSDGISRDLSHICQRSGVGAVVESSAVPIHSDARMLAERDGVSALEHALHDGEDHELLFTTRASPADLANFHGLTRVGQIVGEPGMWLQEPDGSRRPLEPRGWEHRL